MKKVVAIIIILFVMLCVSYGQVYASTYIDPITNPEPYKPIENLEGRNTKFIERANLVLGIIRVAGSFLAVIILMTLGIKYMLGTAAEKADYKNSMIPYLVGAIMVFTIPNVIGILYDIIKNVN